MKYTAPCLPALIAACATSTQTGQPAVVVEPTPASRADLLSSVQAALNNNQILLADTALTQESVLLIERAPHTDPLGLPANGRELQQPERFLLSVQDAHCVLTHERTGRRWQLPHTQCRAQ